MWYTFFKHALFVPYVKLFCRPEVVGEENIPQQGPAILAANHSSAGDTFLLPASIKRQMVFPAKAELFKGNRGPASKVVAWFLKAVGQVPMDRTGGRASAEGLRPVLETLGQGGLVGIFPEGTRSVDGRLYKGKTGVARMALTAGVPVLPVAMSNTELVRNRLGIPVMHHPRIVIGKPLDFSRYADQHDVNKTLRWVTDEIMAGIQELSGATYVDVYGSRVKHGDLKDADVSDRIRQRPGEGAVVPPVTGAAEAGSTQPGGAGE